MFWGLREVKEHTLTLLIAVVVVFYKLIYFFFKGIYFWETGSFHTCHIGEFNLFGCGLGNLL